MRSPLRPPGAVLLTLPLLLGACTPALTITSAGPPPAAPPPAPRLSLPALVRVAVVSADGLPVAAGEDLALRVVTALRDAEVFAAVYAPWHADQAPAETARVDCLFEAAADRYRWSNAGKILLSIPTIYLALGVLPLRYDLWEAGRCHVALPSGAVFEYAATAALSAEMRTLPMRAGGPDEPLGLMQQQGIGEVLRDIGGQLRGDAALRAAADAPAAPANRRP